MRDALTWLAIIAGGGWLLLAVGDFTRRAYLRIHEWREAILEAREKRRWEELCEDTSELRPCDIVFLHKTEQWKAMHGKEDHAA